VVSAGREPPTATNLRPDAHVAVVRAVRSAPALPAWSVGSFGYLQSCNDVSIRGCDQCLERRLVEGKSGLDLDVTHVFSRTLQQTRWIQQRCAVEEADVDVSPEDTDIGEWCVFYAHGGVTIMHEFANVGAALAHERKPRPRDCA
jgi:hypothetical protein